jgi:hypothetical protein
LGASAAALQLLIVLDLVLCLARLQAHPLFEIPAIDVWVLVA